ncbi:hypothetical protein QYE76_016176 [Lolium multiflorum]|uniref:Retrotransposon Copia-like N-terminal domain-containing protein n=1 Tax=Lolium multiflorum TaxID=4521 RepID=A0AAD8U869_LOLMU|nr:hypothetical protein QYE76_016114 [Lolium multiflorum]KAK1699479.1 hypothetical protein QYE76_016176 [Lolium multiflorum]
MASSSTNVGSLLGHPPMEKLTRNNHLLWKAQIMPALRGARMLGIVDGKEPAPPETITAEKDGKATLAPNPAYDTWLTRDQQVLSYLLGALSPEILALAVGMEHAAEVWELVNSMYTSRSKANVTHLRAALSNTKKLNMDADQYVAKMKGFATELIAAGRSIDDDELRDHILNGLDEEYDGVFALVNAMTNCTVSDLHDLIRASDMRKKMLSGGDPKGFESSVNSASRGRGNYKKNYHGRPRDREEDRWRNGGGGRPRDREEDRWRNGGGGRRHPQGGYGRGRGRGGGPPRFRDDTMCQICKKDGHAASTCWWRYADKDNNNDREVNAAYGVDTNWYSDTGATDHITGNLEKLMIRDQYHGKDKIHTANGEENLEQNNQELSQNSTRTTGYFMPEENNGPNSTADLVTGGDDSGATNSGAGSPPSRASSAAAVSHAAEDQSTPTRGQSGADTPASGRATSAPAGPAGGSGTTPGLLHAVAYRAWARERGHARDQPDSGDDCVVIEPKFFRVIFRGARNRVAPGTLHGILCSARSCITSCGTHTSSTRNP